MKKILWLALLIWPLSIMSVSAQELMPGSRVLIKSEGREDYSPRIVDCSSATGICLRDTRSEPANKPIKRTDNGLRVDFPSWDVIYLFQVRGRGSVFDGKGKKIGSFRWSQ